MRREQGAWGRLGFKKLTYLESSNHAWLLIHEMSFVCGHLNVRARQNEDNGPGGDILRPSYKTVCIFGHS